jgi:hypothetical protein
MEFLAVVLVVVFTVIAVRVYDSRKNKVSQKGDIPVDTSYLDNKDKQEP